MKNSLILKTISQILFPFVLLFGFYIILNGDSTPGGGFQGGVVLATSYLLQYFINRENSFNLNRILKTEKTLFLILILFVFLPILTRGIPFTNIFPPLTNYEFKRLYLIALNLIIGLKVAIGLVGVFIIFIEEGHR